MPFWEGDRRGLEFPVSALAWLPGVDELVVATRAGELVRVGSRSGKRLLTRGLGACGLLVVHDDGERLLTLDPQGVWHVRDAVGTSLYRGEHAFTANPHAFFVGEHVVLVGEEEQGAALLWFSEGHLVTRVGLPAGTTATPDGRGDVLLCRSTIEGLERLPLGTLQAGGGFAEGRTRTSHRLRPSEANILGLSSDVVALWSRTGGPPKSMRLPDLVTGCVSHDGRVLAMGTAGGAIVVARIDELEERMRPDMVRAFDQPVRAVAFSHRGRLLATGADHLRIWSMDTDPRR